MVAVARVSVTERAAPAALAAGLGVGLMYEAGLVLTQVAKHAARPGGNFPHANFLGLAADFAVFANLSLMLGSRRLVLPGATVFAGFVIMLGSAGILGVFGATLPFIMVVLLYALELLVAFLQAYVFAILTCIYLNDAFHPGH